MRKLLFIILLTVNCITFAFSQDKKKPDFSGTWSLDISETPFSILGDEQSDKFKREIFKCVGDLTIEFNEPELKIKEDSLCDKKNNTASTYFTDERGETNNDNGVQATSETKLRGNKITIRVYTLDRKGNKETDRNIEISISKKGDKLAHVVSVPGLPEISSKGNTTVVNVKPYTKLVFRKLK